MIVRDLLRSSLPALSAPKRLPKPYWLTSDFMAPVLHADFGSGPPLAIDLDIRLANGLSLLADESRPLLNDIYIYLCVQSRPGLYGNRMAGAEKDRERFYQACKVVDHLLLNDDGQLARSGFAALTSTWLSDILISLTSNGCGDVGLYAWHEKLVRHLRNKVRLHRLKLMFLLRRHPDLGVLDDVEEMELPATEQELRLFRAYFRYMCLTDEAVHLGIPPKDRVHRLSALIKRELYGNTLLGRLETQLKQLHLPAALTLEDRAAAWPLEYRRVLVRNEAERGHTDKQVAAFKSTISSLAVTSVHGSSIQVNEVRTFEEFDYIKHLDVKALQGIQHIHPSFIATSLREAIDFYYEMGEEVLLAAEAAIQSGRDLLASGTGIVDLLPRRLRAVGVVSWLNPLSRSTTDGAAYAKNMRANLSLYDLVLVTFGCAAMVVGVFSAARTGELHDLLQDEVDEFMTTLALISRKTGYDGLRRRDEIPIPSVASEMLNRCAVFQRRTGGSQVVLCPPRMSGQPPARSSMSQLFYQAMDAFCDYFETPLNDEGQRYYYRQHQLRKFFASVFFFCCGEENLDALRWFLRHTDIEHVWVYIRTWVPGEQLQKNFARTQAKRLKEGAKELETLAVLLKEELDVSDFSIIEERQLERKLMAMQQSGDIEFSPVFPVVDGVKTVQIGVVVFPKAH